MLLFGTMSFFTLPPDIILLICEELANLRDFSTLFQCALAGKQLTGPAVLSLYRIHNYASVRGGESNEAEMSRTGDFKKTSFAARQEQQADTVSKWSQQWRSIIMSSIGGTAFPYCLYIYSLDLENLEDLLEDNVFKTPKITNGFFAGEMARFHKFYDTPRKTRSKGKTRVWGPRINTLEVLDAVGESLSKFVGDAATAASGAAALEDLRGGKAGIVAETLPRWVGRFSRLKSITIWDGSVLSQTVGEKINNNCRDFDTLSLYNYRSKHGDAGLTLFLGALRPHSLRSFTVLSYNDIGQNTLLALKGHSQSLEELVMNNLQASAIRALHVLNDCTRLKSLNLHDDRGEINFEATERDSFDQTVKWLTSCTRLENIRFQNFVDGPAFLRAMCQQDNIKLKSLTLVGYTLINNKDFHASLTLQPSLESLELRGDADEATRDDIDGLVSAICALRNLTYLSLLEISDFFSTREVKALADNLPNLEDFSIAGYGVDDGVWSSLWKLHNLRTCSFHSITSFTFNGILNYIGTLQPSNQGLLLSVMCATLESQLSPEEQALLQDTIGERVGGKFEFEVFREAESDIESDSD